MWTKREVIIIFAGGQLPMRVFGFTLTAGRNAWAIALNAAITAALLWWAGRLKRA